MFALVQPVSAELAAVSGVAGPVTAAGDPADVALFPAAPWDDENQVLDPGNEGVDFRGAGYPIWYQDTTGLRLTLCLDGEVGTFPCGWEDSPVFTDNQCTVPLYPYQDVVGFGNEAFYMKATSFPFDVPLTNHPVAGASAQLALLLETTWGGDTRTDLPPIWILGEDGTTCTFDPAPDLHRVNPGSEMLFTRIRLRLLGDQAGHEGWYRITYPYGVKTFYHLPEIIDDDADDRSQLRQQVGDFRLGGTLEHPVFPDYTIALNDPGTLITRFGEANALLNFVDVGGSNVTDIDDSIGFSNDASIGRKNIGPFLYKPGFLTDPTLQIPILDDEGIPVGFHQYIGNPIEAVGGHLVEGSTFIDPRGPSNNNTPTLANYFKIEFIAGVVGSPPAMDAAGWAIVGFSDLFNVSGKVAGCDPENLAPVINDATLDFSVALGGQIAIPITDFITSDVPILNTSLTILTGPDFGTAQVNPDGSITYFAPDVLPNPSLQVITIQISDQCGLVSNIATIEIEVVDLGIEQAQLRVRTGKWLVRGLTSHPQGTEITLFLGVVTFDELGAPEGTVIGSALVDVEGNWSFSGKANVNPAAGTTVTAISDLGIVSASRFLILR